MKTIETLIFLRRVTITPILNLLLIEERKLNNQYQKRKRCGIWQPYVNEEMTKNKNLMNQMCTIHVRQMQILY